MVALRMLPVNKPYTLGLPNGERLQLQWDPKTETVSFSIFKSTYVISPKIEPGKTTIKETP